MTTDDDTTTDEDEWETSPDVGFDTGQAVRVELMNGKNMTLHEPTEDDGGTLAGWAEVDHRGKPVADRVQFYVVIPRSAIAYVITQERRWRLAGRPTLVTP